MGEHSGHVHGPMSGKRLWVSLFVTLAFVVGEAGAGWRAHSLALLSDAAHNLSDALALGLAAFALWIAQRPANARSTFGYHRVAILTALFNALTLLGLAAVIGVEALARFRRPEPVGGSLMIGVAAVAVLMNTVIAWSLSGDAKRSLNSRAAYVHMAGDALSSLAVVIAGVVVHFTGWPYADPLVSALIAVFIAYSAWDIVRDATDILLENTPKGVDVDALVADIRSVPPVCGVHDLHVWTVGDGLNFLSCHVQFPDDIRLSECAAVVVAINRRLHDDFGIGHATIQVEVGDTCPKAEREDVYCEMEPHNHDDGAERAHGH
jgi:cobalt-zinc-cadmium efflux system protein